MSGSSIHVITLSGELEIGRKNEIREALRFSAAPAPAPALVDCSGVTYADSTALAQLMRFHREADTAGVKVALLIGSRQFARLLQYAGLGDVFHVFESRAAALSYLGTQNAT